MFGVQRRLSTIGTELDIAPCRHLTYAGGAVSQVIVLVEGRAEATVDGRHARIDAPAVIGADGFAVRSSVPVRTVDPCRIVAFTPSEWSLLLCGTDRVIVSATLDGYVRTIVAEHVGGQDAGARRAERPVAPTARPRPAFR